MIGRTAPVLFLIRRAAALTLALQRPCRFAAAGRPGFRTARLQVFVLAMTLFCASGCSQFIALGYLIGGPPSVEPDFDRMTKKSMTERGVKVAVVCFAPDEIRLNFTDVDKDIASHVAHRLFEHHILVIHPDKVQEWLDKHDQWDRPEEVGEATGARYVIFIDVNKYNLFEENSHDLFRGRSELLVKVVEMQKDGTGEQVYTKELTSQFPLEAGKSTSDISYDRFRRLYLARLSEEVGRLFYEYHNGDDIGDVI